MNINTLKTECQQELDELLNWWITFSQDKKNGGFYGKIDNQNRSDVHAVKGLVLNARILYTFSSAYLINKKAAFLEIADRAYHYLTTYFFDEKNGGFYWSVAADGSRLDGKKQVYGQAFVIYALSEYYKINANSGALDLAKSTFRFLEAHSFDHINLGYIEALSEDWKPTNELRLSAKDQNEKKSMNTHLHLIEAYGNLYTVWPDEKLKKAIEQLLSNFKDHIIHPITSHLRLFFTETWEVKATEISFGHDIEAAWLLQEVAIQLNDENEISYFKALALKMAKATAKGLAKNGGLYYEFDPKSNHWTKEFHWWPQAEALVGFLNAYEISGDQLFLQQALDVWAFIKKHLKDLKNGEWFWGTNDDYTLMQGEDKAGFWKCPYHNGRACLEVIKRF
jgi:mannobiose 2-epimerase